MIEPTFEIKPWRDQWVLDETSEGELGSRINRRVFPTFEMAERARNRRVALRQGVLQRLLFRWTVEGIGEAPLPRLDVLLKVFHQEEYTRYRSIVGPPWSVSFVEPQEVIEVEVQ